MRYLKIYEEFETSSDFNKRSDYVIDLRDNIKEILLPFTDDGITLSLPNGTLIGMIANVLYSEEYLVTYKDFYKSASGKDLKSLSDLFFVSIKLMEEYWESVGKERWKLSQWIIDTLYHLESYMVSEGFKLEIKLSDMFSFYIFRSVKSLEEFVSDYKKLDIKIGFNI